MNKNIILEELINLSHEVGLESRKLAILGEGNTSADNGDGTFWIKASGSKLGDITADDFCLVNFSRINALMETQQPVTDEQIAEELQNALVENSGRKPSVETFLHALCLQQTGAKFIAHTHPVSVNSILCSQAGASPFLGHLFPDAIVSCGFAPAVIPYVDPGLILAETVRQILIEYQNHYAQSPKILLMVNHGLVALGQTAQEALNISLMADKWAQIILGTFVMNGPHYLSPEHVQRIETRLDEQYRRKTLSS